MKNILGSFAGLLFVFTGFGADAAFLDVPIGYPTILGGGELCRGG